jgi:small redox-active disulfide protein 2
MLIQIYGSGCANCKKLAENAEIAAKESGVEYILEKVTDMKKIVAAGIMMTPALAIDGEVKSAGRALSVKEITKLLAR